MPLLSAGVKYWLVPFDNGTNVGWEGGGTSEQAVKAGPQPWVVVSRAICSFRSTAWLSLSPPLRR